MYAKWIYNLWNLLVFLNYAQKWNLLKKEEHMEADR